jgi:hypothetical protein
MTDALNEIKKLWQLIAVGSSSILELRALPPNGVLPKLKAVTKHFQAAEYPDVEACKRAFEHEALGLNAIGYNIYIVMNPIKEDFSGYAAGDEDIAYRDLLLIDIDRAVKKAEPASGAEIECARVTANELMAYLSSCGFPTPFRVMSGNGHHLYYVLQDVPNTPEATSTVRQVLQNLAARFDDANVKIDTSVFNASRITKVPGTIMRKGPESLLRPYRMAVVYEE